MKLPVAGAPNLRCVRYYVFYMPKVSQILEFYRTGHWKFKMRCPLPFEYELCWNAFFAFGTHQKWISRGKRLKNDLEFHQTSHWKLKTRWPPPLRVWIGLNCIFSLWDTSEVDFKREKTEKWFSRSARWPSVCKNVLPHTSQIWRHQLLATLLLLDWGMMRNIHKIFKFLVWSYKPPEHSPLGS